MKKFIAMMLALVMALSLVACGEKAPVDEGNDEPEYKVAMVTDYGDITDQSFNQTTWEAVVAFGKDNNVETKYYKPTTNDTSSRVASVELAIAEGHNVIVMPGYAFGGTIVECASEYPNVKFIALDVAKGDLLETAVANKGEQYDYNPDNWDLSKYVDMSNVYCAIYQEELAGYMAGYAAVKLGYKHLGYLGGMAVPAVQRFGYGFLQGIDAAADAQHKTGEQRHYHGGGSHRPQRCRPGKAADYSHVRHIKQHLQHIGAQQRNAEPQDRPGQRPFGHIQGVDFGSHSDSFLRIRQTGLSDSTGQSTRSPPWR